MNLFEASKILGMDLFQNPMDHMGPMDLVCGAALVGGTSIPIWYSDFGHYQVIQQSFWK